MTKESFFEAIALIKSSLTALNDIASTIEQNLGYCNESPQMASLGKVDLLTAATELCDLAQQILDKAKALQEYETE